MTAVTRRWLVGSGLAAVVVRGLGAAAPTVAAQAASLDARLVGTWHLVDARCDGSPCSSYVVAAELTLRSDGKLVWEFVSDLTLVPPCNGTWRVVDAGTLVWSPCDRPATEQGYEFGDEFSYRVRRGTLELNDGDDTRIRFTRGPMPRRPATPSPPTCTDDAEDLRLDVPTLELTPDNILGLLAGDALRGDVARAAELRRLVIARNQALTEAWRAFRGERTPVALRATSFSDEGGRSDEYLVVGRGRAEVVRIQQLGAFQARRTCRLAIRELRLKGANRDGRPAFVSKVRSASVWAKLVFPEADGAGWYPAH